MFPSVVYVESFYFCFRCLRSEVIQTNQTYTITNRKLLCLVSDLIAILRSARAVYLSFLGSLSIPTNLMMAEHAGHKKLSVSFEKPQDSHLYS